MAVEFSHERTVLVGALPDAAPNTTPPAAASLLRLQRNPPNGEDEAHSISFYVEANNAAAGTFTWTLWVQDAKTAAFIKVATAAAAADRVVITQPVPVEANCFVQLTAIAGFAAAASLTTRATEQK
jgi:hypothetical protein